MGWRPTTMWVACVVYAAGVLWVFRLLQLVLVLRRVLVAWLLPLCRMGRLDLYMRASDPVTPRALNIHAALKWRVKCVVKCWVLCHELWDYVRWDMCAGVWRGGGGGCGVGCC